MFLKKHLGKQVPEKFLDKSCTNWIQYLWESGVAENSDGFSFIYNNFLVCMVIVFFTLPV